MQTFQANSYYVDRSLALKDMSIGVDTSGMQKYEANLKIALLDNIKTKINDIDTITKALDLAWQGESRDRFDKLFEQSRDKVISDLNREYKNLVARINELGESYIKQDKNMIIE